MQKAAITTLILTALTACVTNETGITYRSASEQNIKIQTLNSQSTKSNSQQAQEFFELALQYEQGNGVAKDEILAIQLYKNATSLGHLEAQEHLNRLVKE
ncbi:hypothetical protein KS4_19370 [Poriferisphaera corsica]|uniref:Sel1 repeat family protein n=1 Tax=Poriferisphaera corsica TaxID=2528020 RepID=A0A517YUG9_9BACT|nr:SEL1-like repeat protein [Poriferisphaera corsica]QDU33878.1 hypothetical protein KS4_19370 [Poriferisphaera corsica]